MSKAKKGFPAEPPCQKNCRKPAGKVQSGGFPPDRDRLVQASREELLEIIRGMLVSQENLQHLPQQDFPGPSASSKPEEPAAGLYDFAPIGFITLDRWGTILEANATSTAMLRPEEGLVGLAMRALVAFPDRSGFDLYLRNIFEGKKQGAPCMVRLKRNHSGFIHARLDGALWSDQNGSSAICRLSIMDVSESKRAETALQEQQNILKLVFELVPDLHSLKDRNFIYQYVNSAFCDYLGLPEEEIVGKTDFDLFPAVKARKYRREDLEVLKSGKTLVKEEDVSTPLFGLKFFRITKNALRDTGGRIIGLLVSIRDVTESKKNEDKLRKLLRLESVGILAGGIAHDFNNLLTGILGNIELAKMFVTPESRAFGRLEQAERASLSAKHLTMQLLTFSRGGVPTTKPSSVGELIQHSAEFTLRGTNVRLEVHMPDDLWLAEVDEGQISQVVQNLVKNAEQAMPEGGRLLIRAENVRVGENDELPLKPGDYIKISVEDTGSGISARHLARIFDPYFTTKQQGNGLGLAICYSIIKQHHGHLDLLTKEGKGTTFFFYLPVLQKERAVEPASSREPIQGKGRVLFMDDEELILDLGREMLRHLGYEVQCVRDGLAAIKAYIRARRLGEPFDLVIMDLTIPGGVGGREAITKLLEIDPEARVIAASGYATNPIMLDFRSYGFQGAVHKPFNIQELGEVLHRALRESQLDGADA